MTGRMQRCELQVPNRQCLSLIDQSIELPTIDGKRRAEVEQITKALLNLGDLGTNDSVGVLAPAEELDAT